MSEQPTQPDESFAETVLDALAASEKSSNQMILIGAPTWVRKIIHLSSEIGWSGFKGGAWRPNSCVGCVSAA